MGWIVQAMRSFSLLYDADKSTNLYTPYWQYGNFDLKAHGGLNHVNDQLQRAYCKLKYDQISREKSPKKQ